MKKYLALLILWFSSLAFGQTFTVTTPTSAMGAGTPTQAITIAISGTTSSTTTFTLTDGGAGGTFWPSSPTISASTNGSTQFVYTPASSASGLITLQAVASGGMAGTHTLALYIGNNATSPANDNFSGTAGTTLVGRAATVGGTWTQALNSGTITEKINGSNGWYRTGTGHVYNQIYIPTNAAGTSCDVVSTISNFNPTTTYVELASSLGTSSSLNGYYLIFVPGTGWNLVNYVGGVTNTGFVDSTHQQLSSGNSATLDIAIRQVNGSQYIWGIVNGLSGSTALNGGVPWQNSAFACNTGYPGYIEQIPTGETPASTDTVVSSLSLTNADWSSSPTLSVSPSTGFTSTPLTVNLTGSFTTWLTAINFSVSGGTSPSLSSCSATTNTAASCTLNPGTSTGTLTLTDNTTGATTSFSVNAPPVVVTFPNSHVTQSPYTWRNPGDGTTWCPATGGCYFKFAVTGTTEFLANVDTTINSCPATDMPFFLVSVNNQAWTAVQPGTSATQATLASGLSTGSTYDMFVYVEAGGTGCGNGWSATNPQMHLLSLQFDNGATLSAYPTVYSKNCLVFGDSYTTPYFGQSYTSGTTPWYSVINPPTSWTQYMAQALGCEVGVIGIGSQGYSVGGNNSYPALTTTWPNYDSTHARSFSQAPDYTINAEGINDTSLAQSTVQSWLTAARSALPNTKIFLYAPTGGEAARGSNASTGGANHAAIIGAIAAQVDPQVYAIDAGTALVCANNWGTSVSGCNYAGATWFNTPGGDDIHPAQTTHGILAGYAVQAIQKAIDPKLGGAYGF